VSVLNKKLLAAFHKFLDLLREMKKIAQRRKDATKIENFKAILDNATPAGFI
jgi:hypothetical protein